MTMRGTYYRWTRRDSALRADILGSDVEVLALPESGMVTAKVPSRDLSPDEARMIGVRLIEAAALADGGRSIKETV